jgi:hypothetical protein
MQFGIFFMPQGYSLHQGGNLDHLRMVLMKVISTVENDTSALFTQENFDSMDFAHMKSSLEVVMKLTAGLAEVNRGEVGQRLPPIRRKK